MATHPQGVVATLPQPTLIWVEVVIPHTQATSQHQVSTQLCHREVLLAQATQELHPHLLIQVTQLVASLEWSIHMCLPLPPQPCHTQFNLVQEWYTKASNNLLDLTQGKTTQVVRTARD